jgi:hypothetical protein
MLPMQGQEALKNFLDQARPVFLPATFVTGSATFGTKTALDNFVLSEDVRKQCV